MAGPRGWGPLLSRGFKIHLGGCQARSSPSKPHKGVLFVRSRLSPTEQLRQLREEASHLSLFSVPKSSRGCPALQEEGVCAVHARGKMESPLRQYHRRNICTIHGRKLLVCGDNSCCGALHGTSRHGADRDIPDRTACLRWRLLLQKEPGNRSPLGLSRGSSRIGIAHSRDRDSCTGAIHH